ncbi:hypothetical protein BGZ68_006193, partial [Mortierella alpina]
VVAATSGQSQIVFGTVLFGRMQGGAGSDRTLGLFINTLPMRVDIEGATVLESVSKVHAVLAGLMEHEHASLAVAQRCSGVPSGTPLFSSMLNYRHNTARSKNKRESNEVETIAGQERTNYPLVMAVEDYGSSLGLTASIVQPYEPARICGYMEQALHKLSEFLVHSPDTPIQPLSVLPAEEYELVVHTWNNTDAPYPSDRCIHELFEDQAERTPDAMAVLHDDRTMTYRELNCCASHLAHRLVDMGVGPGVYVAILLDRSFELIVAQLAVLKAGAAYVPIDIDSPPERQVYIASDCGSTVLITDESCAVPRDIQNSVIRLNTKQRNSDQMHANFVTSRKGFTASSKDTAYVMYTSGSTGLPKGVVVHHQGVSRLVINNGFAEICPTDRMAFTTNPAFDPSTYQVWAPLLHGASVVVINTDTFLSPNRLAEVLARYQVTCLHMTHGILHQYAYLISSALSKLKYLFGGAEQGLIEAYMAVLQHGGPVRLVNRYGPTETTVNATAYTATSVIDKLERLPIGRPISNTRVYILDRYLNPVPVGAIGELYIGGPGVANGYLNRPELTEERFLPDPFATVQGARMYKSGDMARYLLDGNLVFIGRNDNQVKIRGYRVELGEIEARLTEHLQVREALVLATGENSDDKRLIAYIVAAPRDDLVHILRDHLSAILPGYMIPSAFVRMDAFPLTNNGKIDRRSLPDPDNDSFVSSDYVPPEGELEVALAAMWSELLKVERVGRHDNFFMLGGHSLLAVRLISLARSSLGADMKLHMLFSHPTVSGLALHLDGVVTNSTQNDEFSVLIPLKPQGIRPPLFCVHPGPGLSWSYRGLAKYLHPEQPLYGLQSRGLDGMSPMASSMEEMTLDYIEHIRKIQPRGPYHLLGWSFGGKVAHNIAVMLQDQGECVPLLTIMDTIAIRDAHEEVESSVQVESTKYDEYLNRLVGPNSTADALAFKRKVAPILHNNGHLTAHFKPLVYNGDLLFFRTIAREEASVIDPACWQPYVRGSIEAHDVECAHVEMDKPEHIAVVGRIIAAWIEKLQYEA